MELGIEIFDHVFLVSLQPDRCALFKIDDKTTKKLFDATIDASAAVNDNAALGCTQGVEFQVKTLPHKALDPPRIETETG